MIGSGVSSDMIMRKDEDCVSWHLRSARRLRPERGAARPHVSVAPNEIVAIMGRNGMGKTTLLKTLIGILPSRAARSRIDRRRARRTAELRARRQGPRLRAAGPDDLPHAHGGGEHRDRPAWRRASPSVPDEIYELFPVLLRHAQPQGRQPLRRPAAAARDRARARHQAQGAAARRADRGHPAVDHQGHGAHAEARSATSAG